MHPAHRPQQQASAHLLPRDSPQVQLSAPWAVRVEDERDGHSPGMKTRVTVVASPRTHAQKSAKQVRRAPAVGPSARFTPAIRTSHRIPHPKQLRGGYCKPVSRAMISCAMRSMRAVRSGRSKRPACTTVRPRAPTV
jgi:hypothetical protein